MRFRLNLNRKLILVISLLLMAFLAAGAHAGQRLKLSTTTSTEDSGLLKVLLPLFEKRYGCNIDVVAVGTGQALKLGEAGDVDAVLVHARRLEDRFVADGFGIDRRDVMHNDFVLIGPANDPAGVAKSRTAADAMKRLADQQALFISRADKSGTHTREQDLWQKAGIAPKGSWYIEAGQGMGQVITMATERRGYTLADRGTYAAFRRRKTDLVILYQGGKEMLNPYGIMAVNPAKHPHVKYDLAKKLVEFVSGLEGQKIISSFKVNGEQLFFTGKP
jgi:tungstate transport system substrate-binding protein